MILQIGVYVLVTLGWTFYQSWHFLKNKQFKMAVIYSCLMGICTLVGALVIAHVHLPSSTVPARFMYSHFGRMILQQ
ncbi:hypothetical protein [Paenibacillus qinlingensis]|uniref:ABC-type spermidine/putrescine transport system permease subunit II n=1 Tax=Paenibacillus qinlingensis TaxID=1837343 RepID=A0ABU1NRU7_9BACL|nr:hypothetical protein [Paenibacillus qinlingensis]MDR6550163.1 ABC-type spermidine/putrescine transport system permease subunit II [Paenibacillus qinlingensis]